MSFRNRISQTLHDEHSATLALMQRLEQLIARHRRNGAPPDTRDAAVAKLLSDLPTCVEAEFQRHFAFEEDRLFTYLSANGEEAIGAHLTDEHVVIRPLALGSPSWRAEQRKRGSTRRSGRSFAGSARICAGLMQGHVQKEETALLPLIEDNMDAQTEARFFEEYLETA